MNPYQGDKTNPEALRNVLGLGLLSLGVGSGARSLIGIKDMFAKQFRRRKPPTKPAVVEVTVPDVKEEEENGTPYTRPASLFKSSELHPDIDVKSLRPNYGTSSIGNWLAGRTHTGLFDKPWFLPAASAATVGGLYGGYKSVDALMENMHKKDKERELEEAKEEYRNALVEQYTPDSPAVKRSSALKQDLDKLYTIYKSAVSINDIAGSGTGAYITLAGLLAGGTGLATYQWAKKHSPDERLAQAIKQRERLRWATRPPEIYAVTKPKPVRIGTDKPQYEKGTEEAEELVQKYSCVRSKDKIAALYKP